MILCVGTVSILQKDLLELVSEFTKAAVYKIQLFLDTNNK
jgi:hypothetical protein